MSVQNISHLGEDWLTVPPELGGELVGELLGALLLGVEEGVDPPPLLLPVPALTVMSALPLLK